VGLRAFWNATRLWQQTALMMCLSTTPGFQALRATGPKALQVNASAAVVVAAHLACLVEHQHAGLGPLSPWFRVQLHLAAPGSVSATTVC